jgi:trigger factor
VGLTIEIEVKPEISPSNYTGRTVEAPKTRVRDEFVISRLEALRAKNATFVEEPKAYEAGDALVLDHQVIGPDGLTILTETDKMYQSPESELVSDMVADLIGKSAGESGETKDQDGNTHRWTLRSVRARKLPELDDEFAKDLGKGSLEELRQSLTEEIEKELHERALDGAFDKLVEALVADHPFDVPPTLMENVSKELANQDYMVLRYTGRIPERLAEGYDEQGNRSKKLYEAALRRDSEQRVRGYLLLDAIGIKENLTPSEEDINKALGAEAARQRRKPIAVRAALERQRRWNDFVENVRFDKIREFLLANTTINWIEEPTTEAADGAGSPAAE